MRSVTFSFRPEIPLEKRMELLDAISRWDAVLKASLLKPDARNATVQLLAYANVDETADIEGVAKRIAEMPEIESASVPARRKLL